MKLRTLIFTPLIFYITSCNPLYVMNAAVQQSKIILGREKIDNVIKRKKYSKEIREKLRYVQRAKMYAANNSLSAHDAFSYVTMIEKETLTWVLMASRKESFTLKTWWFPVVGSVPYKGFFSKQDAIKAAQKLEKEGFETFIRGASAYSTLGWFNDPILTPALKGSIPSIVNTVFHELVHKSFWRENDVPFNESLATFVGNELSVEFFGTNNDTPAFLKEARRRKQIDLTLETTLTNLVEELSKLYASKRSLSDILKTREDVFQTHIASYRKLFPESKALRKINNAEIMQLYTYVQNLHAFEELYRHKKYSWAEFWLKIKEINETAAENSAFELLKKKDF